MTRKRHNNTSHRPIHQANGGVASLKFKYAIVEQAECMQKRNIYKQRRPRWDTTKGGVSSGYALFAKINSLLVMVGYKNVYEHAFIHFALIGDTYHQRGVPTSSQIIIGSTHTFWNITSRIHLNCDRIFPYFGSKCVRKCVFAYT